MHKKLIVCFNYHTIFSNCENRSLTTDNYCNTVADRWQTLHGSWTVAAKQSAGRTSKAEYHIWTIWTIIKNDSVQLRLRYVGTFCLSCADYKYIYLPTGKRTIKLSVKHSEVQTYKVRTKHQAVHRIFYFGWKCNLQIIFVLDFHRKNFQTLEIQLLSRMCCSEYLHVAIACWVIKYEMNVQGFTRDHLTAKSTHNDKRDIFT